MQLRQSQRQQTKIKMALQGSSGSGKTMSALLIAYGITNDWNKIAIIDTESKSADLYAHLGQYKVLTLDTPHSPERYVEAITLCENSGIEVVIIDSISHCWEYLLDFHANLVGNSFQNWNKVNPRQKLFIDKILNSSAHIIATMRVKQDYVLNQKDGKYIPEKVGLKSVMRDGIDYEFTIVLDIDIKHNAIASKDRTNLFMNKPEFVINIQTGKAIKQWCESAVTPELIKEAIRKVKSLEELNTVFRKYSTWYNLLQDDFMKRKQELQPMKEPVQNVIANLQNFSTNGTHNSTQQHQ